MEFAVVIGKTKNITRYSRPSHLRLQLRLYRHCPAGSGLLALGALVMHGSGEHFSDSGAKFANQLINLYSQVMGGESRYLIGIVAFYVFSAPLSL